MDYIFLLVAGIFFVGCGMDIVKDECRAENYQHLIGKNIDTVDTKSFDIKVRVIKPDMMHDMMFDPGRLNLKIDKDDRVIRVFCG